MGDCLQHLSQQLGPQPKVILTPQVVQSLGQQPRLLIIQFDHNAWCAFEGEEAPGPNKIILTGASEEFSLTLWDAIVGDDLLFGMDDRYGITSPPWVTQGQHLLYYDDEQLASGALPWLEQLKTLHKEFYEELHDRLSKFLSGPNSLLTQAQSIAEIAQWVRRSLEIVASGGLLFDLGQCDVCVALADS